MSKKAVFIIDLEGNLKVDSVEGLGGDCLKFTSPIERRLGGADERTRKLTDEINETSSGSSEIEVQ